MNRPDSKVTVYASSLFRVCGLQVTCCIADVIRDRNGPSESVCCAAGEGGPDLSLKGGHAQKPQGGPGAVVGLYLRNLEPAADPAAQWPPAANSNTAETTSYYTEGTQDDDAGPGELRAAVGLRTRPLPGRPRPSAPCKQNADVRRRVRSLPSSARRFRTQIS